MSDVGAKTRQAVQVAADTWDVSASLSETKPRSRQSCLFLVWANQFLNNKKIVLALDRKVQHKVCENLNGSGILQWFF